MPQNKVYSSINYGSTQSLPTQPGTNINEKKGAAEKRT